MWTTGGGANIDVDVGVFYDCECEHGKGNRKEGIERRAEGSRLERVGTEGKVEPREGRRDRVQKQDSESVGNGSGSGARDETGPDTDTQRHCSPSGAENHRLGADVASTTSWHLHRRKQAGSHHRIRPS